MRVQPFAVHPILLESVDQTTDVGLAELDLDRSSFLVGSGEVGRDDGRGLRERTGISYSVPRLFAKDAEGVRALRTDSQFVLVVGRSDWALTG